MKREYHLWWIRLASALCLFSIAVACGTATAAEVPLKKGVRIVMAGDTATANATYPKLVELYLTVCRPDLDAQVLPLGSRTTIDGFLAHMPLMVRPYKPDVITICYGQEECGASSFIPSKGENYSKGLNAFLEDVKTAKITAVVGSPIAVDTYYFKVLRTPAGAIAPENSGDSATIANESLARFGALARAGAESHQMPFADVHTDLCAAMKKAKDALGSDYSVCGVDPKYPAITPNGYLVIAYSFLKAMGLSGDIGTITLDMKGTAKATDGHKILSSQNGRAEIESSRYPFCFAGDEKSPNGTRSILPFVPFNQDLNRFMLVVRNLDSEKAKVTWGTATKVFTKKELESGINLAEAFAESNPFSETFQKIDAAVTARQTNAQRIYFSLLNIDKLFCGDPEGVALRDKMRQKFFDKLDKTHAEIQAMVTPLTHTLTVTPE